VDSVAHKTERHRAGRIELRGRINRIVHNINRIYTDKSKKYCVYLLYYFLVF
jgi:hypothetical protein